METHSVLQSVDAMQETGVCVFRNIVSQQAIPVLKNEISAIREYVMQKIQHMDRPLRTYTDIAERHLGRFDYRCGFTAEIFKLVEKPIAEIVKRLSPQINFHHYWGAIPSLPGSGPTDMHRDIYPILNTMKGNDLDNLDVNLPPYYFTALIPLVEITSENGPTEFIPGSHRKKIIDETHSPIFAPLTKPGDVVIFEGRTLHRGSANQSNEERLVAYITFVADWYHDQTFKVNDFLFPELND